MYLFNWIASGGFDALRKEIWLSTNDFKWTDTKHSVLADDDSRVAIATAGTDR